VLYFSPIKSASLSGQDVKADIVMEVCFRPLDQDEKSCWSSLNRSEVSGSYGGAVLSLASSGRSTQQDIRKPDF